MIDRLRPNGVILGWTVVAACQLWLTATAPAAELERVRVSADQQGFVLEPSGRPFVPWGFNYDHDEQGRLLEDYWDREWERVSEDFAEMRDLGANVVRIHLQTARFLKSATDINEQSLRRLQDLLTLAAQTGLYLDLTGLGCYHKQDVPAWYDELDESGRWRAQIVFWEAVARTCQGSSAVFCYDLMNEPVVPGGRREPRDWLGPAFVGKHFVQFITLDQRERPRATIARDWIHQLATAIRRHDDRHLITVGLVDWSLDRPGLTSGFPPDKVIDDLDFVSVHLYPQAGRVEEALQTLRGFALGKPVVIEETFPLRAPLEDFEKFLDGSRPVAAGWIGFYWGQTADECRRAGTIAGAITAAWLDLFVRRQPHRQK